LGRYIDIRSMSKLDNTIKNSKYTWNIRLIIIIKIKTLISQINAKKSHIILSNQLLIISIIAIYVIIYIYIM